MDSRIEEARQDKINAQNELNEARNEFKNWKQQNGIKPQDPVYMELKQAEIAAAENFAKARDIYSAMINSISVPTIPAAEKQNQSQYQKSYGAAESQVPIENVSLLGKASSPSRGSSRSPLRREGFAPSLSGPERFYAQLREFGPPTINPKMQPGGKAILHFKIKPIILVICFFSILQNISEILEGGVLFGSLFLLVSTFGILAVFTSNLELLVVFGWSKLIFEIFEFIVNMVTFSRHGGQIVVNAIFQLIFTIGYLYCIQKLYYSLAYDDGSSPHSLIDQDTVLHWDD